MTNTQRIRELNDQFRGTLVGGRLMLTRGIAGRQDLEEILTKVRQFDRFSQANDPYTEHDFAAFEAGAIQSFGRSTTIHPIYAPVRRIQAIPSRQLEF